MKIKKEAKAISSIIGTLLILIITIGLVGFSYSFISGVFTSKTSTAFSVVDAFKDTITVINSGTDAIKEIKATEAGNPVDLLISPFPIPPGQTATIQALSSLPEGKHTLRLCTSSMCSTAIITVLGQIMKIISSPAILFVPSVVAAGPDGIYFQSSAGSDLAVIKDDGSVGIGTTSPAKKLHVFGGASGLSSSSGTDVLIEDSAVPTLQFLSPSSSYNLILFGDTATSFSAAIGSGTPTGTSGVGDLEFRTGGTGGAQSRMVITPSGNVGIGTTTPSSKLEVSGGGTTEPTIKVSTTGGSTIFLRSRDTDALIGTLTNHPLSLRTNGLSRIDIDTSGNVGIGTASPSEKLSVLGTIGVHSSEGLRGTMSTDDSSATSPLNKRGLYTTAVASRGIHFKSAGSASDFSFQDSNANVLLGIIASTGNVGIGKTAPLDKLDVSGDIRVGTGTTGCVKDADGTILAGTCSSDIKLKKNIAPLPSVLDKVTQLQPVYFQWRSDEYPEMHMGNETQIGLIAQQVEQYLPELVTEKDGIKQIHNEELPYLMLQALKDLKAENDALKARIAKLEGN
ncbi:MAG: tail fiber domain-containing protein [Candidatus Aenigmarchaeota archaeon]|nr:tail fiber domain-containing protein [Candidatus Aenigmarchaeota archaeon]